ncbi:MAG: hypothetical protein Q9193_005616 [Seirophora villosa]
MVPHDSARSATRDTHSKKTVTRDDTKKSRHTMVLHESPRSGSTRVKTIYEDDDDDDDEKTVTREDTKKSRHTMVPHESARSVIRDERSKTRDENNDRRTMVRYESARSVARPAAPSNHGASSSSRTNSRAVGPQVQSIRDPSSSSSRTTQELKQRVKQLEDEKTQRLERQVEKLGDQVAQMQMGRSAAPAIFVPAPAYCACEYCRYGAGIIYFHEDKINQR